MTSKKCNTDNYRTCDILSIATGALISGKMIFRSSKLKLIQNVLIHFKMILKKIHKKVCSIKHSSFTNIWLRFNFFIRTDETFFRLCHWILTIFILNEFIYFCFCQWKSERIQISRIIYKLYRCKKNFSHSICFLTTKKVLKMFQTYFNVSCWQSLDVSFDRNLFENKRSVSFSN